MYYIAYELEREDGRFYKVELARIQDNRVYGPEASRVKKLLEQNGWPKKEPHKVLHGSSIWVSKPVLTDNEEPKEGWIVNEDYRWEKDIIEEEAANAAKLTNRQV